MQAFDDHLRHPGPLGPLIIFSAYVVSTIFVLPLFGLHFAAGYAYGTIRGTALVLTAEVTSACLVFLCARRFFRPLVKRLLAKRLGAALRTFDALLSGGGALKRVVLLRMSPVVPASLMNYAAAVTSVDFWNFALGTAGGMAPGTCAYVNLGSVSRTVKDGGTSSGTLALYVAGAFATVYIGYDLARGAQRPSTEEHQYDEGAYEV
eukprot:TRINITY_DN74303_c0_g1_i1.p1 TRINITY_DN74303_c0_g1~~TRINITY_DN74303_c0_g1_i1.p1  ORF type:complete len:206 (-),score=21.81 TRINITY_DN74303_c0_g1_i1:154-771(-)